MRFVSFSTPDGPRGGLLRDGRVFDTGRTLLSLVETGGLDEVSAEGDGVPLEERVWLKAGDRVEVRSPQLGVLETTLA